MIDIIRNLIKSIFQTRIFLSLKVIPTLDIKSSFSIPFYQFIEHTTTAFIIIEKSADSDFRRLNNAEDEVKMEVRYLPSYSSDWCHEIKSNYGSLKEYLTEPSNQSFSNI